jgi:predicted nucleic acid-binding protein
MVHNHKGVIILPVIAISELLVPVPDANKGAVIATLEKLFLCAPFDVQAASIAAELFAKRDKIPQKQRYDKRYVLKADAMIIASAKAAGATEFYTHDESCRALAKLEMASYDLPTGKGSMEEIFIASDIKDGKA